MRRRLSAWCALLLAVAPLLVAQAPARDTTLVSFDDAPAWRAIPSDGVKLALGQTPGVSNGALRFDFDFQGHGGYGIARHSLVLPPLPSHWAMTLKVRGHAPPNTIEIKFVDASGQNVWWMRKIALPVPAEWTELRFRPADLSFAWGPLGGGPPRDIAAIEIAITAASGGSGWIALDDLRLLPLPSPVAQSLRPVVSASSSVPGSDLPSVLPATFYIAPVFSARGRAETSAWRTTSDGEQSLTLDFGGSRQLSGLVLDWDTRDWATRYGVLRSDDGAAWTPIASVAHGAGGRRFIHLPETEARWIRIAAHSSSRGHGYGLRALYVLPDSAAPTGTAFLERVAAAEPPGWWPRQLMRQQSFWTVVGIPRDERDAIMSEDGSIESRPGSFSIEPFVFADSRLLAWSDGIATHSLDGGWRPIPSVRRVARDAALDVTTFASGEPGHSVVHVRYRVANRAGVRRRITIAIAVRPVQVNPPWQFLGTAGGASPIRSLRASGGALVVNDSDRVVPMTPGSAMGVAPFDAGSIVEWLARDALPAATAVVDDKALASGALRWTLDLAAHDSADVWVALPSGSDSVATTGPRALASARREWDDELRGTIVDFPLDGAPIARTIRTALADVLINARGPAIQPGTRSYRRSWIRDGALTSSALLRLGHGDDVRAFLEWYLPHVFDDGKAPCCVDARGSDPVPENDSDGELLYLAAEYLRQTADTATIVSHWPALTRTAAHLDSLRSTRRTAQYRSKDSLLVYGLLPPSISHEGYSAKAAYSYWDDWWGVRGMRDGAWLARVARDTTRARTLAIAAREFTADVVASARRAMDVHHMAVLPGAAELGDFDPTSTTIALEPGPGLSVLPRRDVQASFDSAWVSFVHRRDGTAPWDVYTPYEWRVVGSYIRLEQPERAHALASWYMATRRPAEWNEWSEAVWRDARAPKFIGDMPHGWVESDFIRATLDFVAWEREADSTLVIGAGIPLTWARAPGGVHVERLHTWWGALSLRARATAQTATITIDGVTPPGGLEVRAPFGATPVAVVVNATPAALTRDGRAVIVRAPVKSPIIVEFRYSR